jgi:hypothetical protein
MARFRPRRLVSRSFRLQLVGARSALTGLLAIVSLLMLTPMTAIATSSPSLRAHPTASRIYFFDNLGLASGLRQRPAQIDFDADGNNTVTGLHWRGWGGSIARGSGTNHVDNCVPSCAQGHIAKVHVVVTLSSPGRFRGHRVYRCWAVKPRPDFGDLKGCLP